MTDLPTSGRDALAAVREGMHVVDSGGDDVGKVVGVHFGDPDAVTADGQYLSGDERLPAGTEQRLLRVGYVRIHAKGWFAGNRWAAADDVSHVADGVVHLGVSKDSLLK